MRHVSLWSVISLCAIPLALVACGDDDGSGGSGGGGNPSDGGGGSGAGTNGGGGAGAGETGGGGSGGGSTLQSLECEVIIVGGGVSGTYSAFRLAPELGEGVCLFEKEGYLGGRMKDVSFDGSVNDPMKDRAGVGGRRVMPQQQILIDLAEELGIELAAPELGSDLVNARGVWGLSKEELLPAYPTITPDDSGDTETAMYEELLFGESRATVGDYDNFPAFVQENLGNEAFAFLHDASRFRADFEYPLDATGYMDYLTEEWDVYGTPSYPVGGMSAYVLGMQDVAEEAEARIFTNEPVARIERDGEEYVVETATYRATAPKVIVAVPPIALNWIEGDVAEDLKEAQQFKDIIAVKVVTVTQWWDERWWDEVMPIESTTPVWRAWTTEHCLTFIEIPLEPYTTGQNVTRSVYNDDLQCTEFWQTLYETGGEAAVEAEVKRGLEHLFLDNGVTTAPAGGIPDPTKTYVQIWDTAWHWLEAGTQYTNTQVFDWSVEPLEGEEVSLVGEAYNVNRSGWSDGAYKSAIRVLEERYGLDLTE